MGILEGLLKIGRQRGEWDGAILGFVEALELRHQRQIVKSYADKKANA